MFKCIAEGFKKRHLKNIVVKDERVYPAALRIVSRRLGALPFSRSVSILPYDLGPFPFRFPQGHPLRCLAVD